MPQTKRASNKKSHKVKVIVACPFPIYAESVSTLLESDKRINVVGAVSNLINLIEATKKKSFDILLIDAELKGLNLNKILELARKNKSARVILLVDDEYSENLLISGLRSGIRGYINKKENSKELIKAIIAVYDGELWADRKIMGKVVDGKSYPTNEFNLKGQIYDLTETEIKIIKLVLKGMTNKEIATGLYISEKTVKFHLYKVFKKLSLKNRSELMLFGFQNGLIN
ncbi:MAG: response regulator transcription factor [Thermodesulfobacteriota bacterium]